MEFDRSLCVGQGRSKLANTPDWFHRLWKAETSAATDKLCGLERQNARNVAYQCHTRDRHLSNVQDTDARDANKRKELVRFDKLTKGSKQGLVEERSCGGFAYCTEAKP